MCLVCVVMCVSSMSVNTEDTKCLYLLHPGGLQADMWVHILCLPASLHRYVQNTHMWKCAYLYICVPSVRSPG